ncbi:homoserine O-acetyltransferase [Mycena latifolia]|nr:homoserine O-acetyltransferase [Mycena latifolia]
MLPVLKNKSTLTLPKFDLECGTTLPHVEVVYKTWGTLNAARNNVMVICHAFTGSVDVDEWWGTLMGRGKAFDPTRYFIFCANVLGSPYGSTAPVTVNPATGTPYGPEFPPTTIRDDIRLHKLILDYLGIPSVAVVIGGSMGGMTALEWPLCYPGFVKRIIPMATTAKQSAWCIGWGEAQRQTIYGDAAFQNGYYEHQPTQGLAAARMAGLLTYRSRDSYEERFGRRIVQAPDHLKSYSKKAILDDLKRPMYSAQSYLLYQGAKFAAKFDANCYIHITHKMDTHDLTRDRFPEDVDENEALSLMLAKIPEQALIISIDSDGLVLPHEQKTLADGIPKAELAVISSIAGHDGFLVECDQVNAIVVGYLRRQFAHLYLDRNDQVNGTTADAAS